jgi:hypothetical protein
MLEANRYADTPGETEVTRYTQIQAEDTILQGLMLPILYQDTPMQVQADATTGTSKSVHQVKTEANRYTQFQIQTEYTRR